MEGQVFATAIIAADTAAGSSFNGTKFTGTFDGNDCTITNFTINGGSNHYLGLFGYIGIGIDTNGLVENLGLENFEVSGSSVYYVGGLAGYSDGDGITNCYSMGSVSGSYDVGGLVGRSSSSISQCYSTGPVSGSNRVGGLVGWNYSGGDISNCYSTGNVNGTSNIGGLLGYNYSTVSGSYFLNTSGPANGYGTPLTDAQMKQQASFAGWDFLNIWTICEGTNYPKLTWQIPLGDFVCPDGVDFYDFAVFANQWFLKELTFDVWPSGGDGVVDFFDWAVFANQWQITIDYESLADFADQWLKTVANYYIADIAPDGGDGTVNMLDLVTFTQHWLE
jgi:hypothetical protein